MMAGLLGGGLVLAAIVPGLGLAVFLGIVVFGLLSGAALFGGKLSGGPRSRPGDMVGPSDPDDMRS